MVMTELLIYLFLTLGYGLKLILSLLEYKEAIITILVKIGGLLF
jgi:hypothetical protein